MSRQAKHPTKLLTMMLVAQLQHIQTVCLPARVIGCRASARLRSCRALRVSRFAAMSDVEKFKYQTIVLGGGVAGGYFAQEWIKEGGDGRQLAIISSEKVRHPASAGPYGCTAPIAQPAITTMPCHSIRIHPAAGGSL